MLLKVPMVAKSKTFGLLEQHLRRMMGGGENLTSVAVVRGQMKMSIALFWVTDPTSTSPPQPPFSNHLTRHLVSRDDRHLLTQGNSL
jgi:hypothetical protein